MSDFKGTPGPWFVDRNGIEARWNIDNEDGDSVAITNQLVGDRDWEIRDANTALIAAAPELLESLQELFADYKQLVDSGDAGFWNMEDTEVGRKSLAAIAKALGK